MKTETCGIFSRSIRRSQFNNILNTVVEKSINAFYYTFTYSNRVNHLKWCDANIKHTLSLIFNTYKDYPIFVSLDDTLIEKFGKKFENATKLFDHVDKKFKNGHCLVGMLVSMPFMNSNGGIQYIHVPYIYEMWIPKDKLKKSTSNSSDTSDDNQYQSKLDIVERLFRRLIGLIGSECKVYLCADSWYTNSKILKLCQSFSNVYYLGATKKNLSVFELPHNTAGKRGRKAKK